MNSDRVIRLLNWFDDIRGARLARLTEHERLIAELRMPAREAQEYRRRLFQVLSDDHLSRERWKSTRTRCDEVSRELVELADLLQTRRTRALQADGPIADVIGHLFDHLLTEVARNAARPIEAGEPKALISASEV